MPKQRRSLMILVVAAVVVAAFFGFHALTKGGRARPDLADRFTRELANGKVATATVQDKDHTVTGKLRNGTEYTVSFPAQYDRAPHPRFVDAGIDEFDTDHQSQSAWLGLLYGLLPFVLLALVLMWVLGQVQGGGGRVEGFGKAKTKTLTKDQPKVTFADVAGLDEAVEELAEIKEFLESTRRASADGREDSEGRAALRSAGHRQDAARQGGRRRGGRAVLLDQRFRLRGDVRRRRRVAGRDLFEQAKAAAPAIIFVDEIDAVGVTAVPASVAATTSANRRSTSCSWRWTASTRSRA